MTGPFHDLHYAFRQLRKTPRTTAVVVVTLAVGLAAVSTIFAVVETVVLRPLNFKDSDRIVLVSQTLPALAPGPVVANLGEFLRWQESGSFEKAAAIETKEYTLLGSGQAQRLFGVRVTPDFFQIFRVQPFLGRWFTSDDAGLNHDRVIVLSHQLWMRSFAGDRNIIGRTIRTSDGPMTVIGVMPPRFDFPRLADVRAIMPWSPEQTEFWTPFVVTQGLARQGSFYYLVIGRLKTGVTTQSASQQLDADAVNEIRDEQVRNPSDREVLEQVIAALRVNVTPLRESMSWGIRRQLWMLLVAVGMLLALVLFNVGNLLLTSYVNRLKELAVRHTLGATRGQLFCESVAEQVLAVGAALLVSLFLTNWAISAIRSVAANRLPRLYDLSVDGHVAALLVLLSLLISVLFGAVPILVLPVSALSSLLQSEGRASTADRRTTRIKSGLMVMQIGISTVLLVGAGLLIQSFTNIMRVNPGFDPHNLLNVSVSLNPKANQDPAQWLAHVRALLDAFRRIPGVESAAVVNEAPLTGELDIRGATAVGRPSPPNGEGSEFRVVDASYFRTMRIPLIAGREFRDSDAAGVTIVNRKMALRLWPGEDAVDKQLQAGDGPPLTVIGVVGDVHDASLDREPRMQFYQPLAASPWRSEQFMIRTRIDPDAVMDPVQHAVWQLDPEQPISHAQTMERLLQSTTLDRRFANGLICGFAAAALLLATMGLFSLASLSLAQRTREFGVRLALGATPRDLLWLEILRSQRLALAGLILGIAVSLAGARTAQGFLYGVTAWSPEIYFGAIAVLMLPTLIASYLPARRAAKIEPMEALRYE